MNLRNILHESIKNYINEVDELGTNQLDRFEDEFDEEIEDYSDYNDDEDNTDVNQTQGEIGSQSIEPNNETANNNAAPDGSTMYDQIVSYFDEHPESYALPIDANDKNTMTEEFHSFMNRIDEKYRNRIKSERDKTFDREQKFIKDTFNSGKYGFDSPVTPNEDLYANYYNWGKNGIRRNFKCEVDPNKPPKNGRGYSELFKFGNDKVASNTLIIDFTSAIQCPSLSSCPVAQVVCYGVAAENQYKATSARAYKINELTKTIWANHKNKELFNSQLKEFFGIAKDYLKAGQDRVKRQKAYNKNPQSSPEYPRFVRINAVGDFLSQEWLDTADEFAGEVESELGVRVMCYTARTHLNFKDVKHLIINASAKPIADMLPEQNIKRQFLKNEKINYALLQAYTKLDVDLSNPDDPKVKEAILNADVRQTDGPEKVEKYILQNRIGGVKIADDPNDPLDKSAPTLINGCYVCPCTVNKNAKPCGVDCQVCYGKKKGVVLDPATLKPTGEELSRYNILIAVHGSSKGNFNDQYHDAKVNGDKNVKYAKDNKFGSYWVNKQVRGLVPDTTTLRLEKELFRIQNGYEENNDKSYVEALQQLIKLGHKRKDIQRLQKEVENKRYILKFSPKYNEMRSSGAKMSKKDIQKHIIEIEKGLKEYDIELNRILSAHPDIANKFFKGRNQMQESKSRIKSTNSVIDSFINVGDLFND